MSFSPDGTQLANSPRATPPVITDVAGGGTLNAGHRGPVAFSAGGLTLITGGADKTLQQWDLKSRSDRKVLSGPGDIVYGRIAYSTTKERLAAACASEGIYLWDLGQEKPKHVLKHGSYFTRSALFSPSGDWLMTGGWDGTTRVWNAETGELRAKLGGSGGINCFDYEPRAGLLAVAAYGKSVQLHAFSFDAPSEAITKQIRELLSRFEDDRYEIREAASAELIKLGFAAEQELQIAAEKSPSVDVRIRASRARQAIADSHREALVGPPEFDLVRELFSGRKVTGQRKRRRNGSSLGCSSEGRSDAIRPSVSRREMTGQYYALDPIEVLLVIHGSIGFIDRGRVGPRQVPTGNRAAEYADRHGA